jgi:two-component system, OmpR family, sensor kinase
MTSNLPRRSSALLRRLLRAQLRLKVMAGVVVVTLVALVAFDVAAVATMRRYLLGQTDNNLKVALNLTVPRVAGELAQFSAARAAQPAGLRPPNGRGGRVASPGVTRPPATTKQGRRAKPPPGMRTNPPFYTVAGAYDMNFLSIRGAQVTLQVAANGDSVGYGWTLSKTAAKLAVLPGPHIILGPPGKGQLQVQSAPVPGGFVVAGASLDQVDRTIGQVESIVVFGSLAVVALIGLGVFLVLRRGLRPIESMAAQADRITAGDLTERVTAHSPRSEVGRLGTALNGMLARIETDVRERDASQDRMRRFFADASHELRTPIASLRANAELYHQGALASAEELDEVMFRITLETRRMGRLVDDMLRLARLGQHPSRYRAPVDLSALLSASAERVRIADPARRWQVHIVDGLATVGDEELLRRAVDNLLTNVLVHTPSETVGTITAFDDGETIMIEVSDDGPGVPPDLLPHIFERFYRGSARPSRPGSGLGLAIVAEIATAHGGTARAAPAAPHGLAVTLTLPPQQEDQDYPERSGATLPPVRTQPDPWTGALVRSGKQERSA